MTAEVNNVPIFMMSVPRLSPQPNRRLPLIAFGYNDVAAHYKV